MPKFLSAITVPSAVSGYMAFAPYVMLSANISAAGNNDVFTGVVGVNATFRRWAQWAMVNGTSNGSNYWTLTLISVGGATIATLNTSGLTASAWGVLSSTGLSASALANTFYLVRAAKTGTPGPLFLATPAVYVE